MRADRRRRGEVPVPRLPATEPDDRGGELEGTELRGEAADRGGENAGDRRSTGADAADGGGDLLRRCWLSKVKFRFGEFLVAN